MGGDRQDELITQLTSNQNRLYGFILTLIPDRNCARDVLQETNLVIWRKADEYAPGTNFWAWATRIAHYQVLAFHRDTARDRHVFDVQLLDYLKAAAENFSGDDERRRALHDCLAKLDSRQKDLVADRYRSELPLDEISRRSGRTVAAVKMALLRLRRTLLDPGGANFAMGDGSVHFFSESIDFTLFGDLGTIAGGEVATPP